MDPRHLLNTFGPLGLIAIIFAETGLLVGIVLPGDSLLFTAGLLSATHRHGSVHLNLAVVLLGAFVAAVVGAQVGHQIGRSAGPRLFARQDSRLFKQEYVERARLHFERYGSAKAVVLARFTPVIRTLMNPLAGVLGMPSTDFLLWNVVGALPWAVGITVAGYFLGKSIPNVDHYLLPVVALVVLVSLIPVALEVRRTRRAGAAGQ